MIIKQIPQDFIVDEIYDLDLIRKKKSEDETYHYFILTKEDYSQIKAILKIAKVFGISRKRVHFAGTKDKVGITSQLICISKINPKTFENNIKYFNGFSDLHLEYLGEFNSRLNLGDNLGNKFKITIRNLDENEIGTAKLKIEEIKNSGVLNYYDSQRFGSNNNTHIIGKYILQNKMDLAVKEILDSYHREDDKEKLRIEGFLNKYENDYSGAFRTVLHKKLRTLYINAYQSHIFNKILDELKPEKNSEIQLVNHNFKEKGEIKKIVDKILKEDNLEYESFKLKHMPDLETDVIAKRNTKSFPKNIKVLETDKDELNESKEKMIIEYELDKGEYATNIIKHIFN